MDKAYIDWVQDLKQKIQSAQIKASIAINEALIFLYWDIGKSIVEKQNQFSWGTKVVEQIAKDLKRELPETNGFSRTNLFSMRKFYLFYADSQLVKNPAVLVQVDENQTDVNSNLIVHQAGGQLEKNSILGKIPWRHHNTGKMNYYLSAIDNQLKTEHDNPSIGIILCKSKDKLEVEYALQDINKPMGISEFTFKELPQNIQNNMPTVEELENELKKII